MNRFNNLILNKEYQLTQSNTKSSVQDLLSSFLINTGAMNLETPNIKCFTANHGTSVSSDDEDPEKQEVNLLFQQSILLSSLISQLQQDIKQVSSILNKKDEEEQTDSVKNNLASKQHLPTNGIQKSASKTDSKNIHKLKKRRMINQKKLNISRKISLKLCSE